MPEPGPAVVLPPGGQVHPEPVPLHLGSRARGRHHHLGAAPPTHTPPPPPPAWDSHGYTTQASQLTLTSHALPLDQDPVIGSRSIPAVSPPSAPPPHPSVTASSARWLTRPPPVGVHVLVVVVTPVTTAAETGPGVLDRAGLPAPSPGLHQHQGQDGQAHRHQAQHQGGHRRCLCWRETEAWIRCIGR